MYWYWYVSWRVCQWKHANTDHNTYQYHRYISAAGVKTNPYWYVLWYVLVCFWYVLVCFGMYLKPFWHTGFRRAPVVLVRIVYVFARILVCIDPYIVILHMLSTYWSVLKLLVSFMHVSWLIPIHVYTYQYTYVPEHTLPSISAPRALMRESGDAVTRSWSVSRDGMASDDWKTRSSDHDDCQWSASNYWLARNDWTAIVSLIAFVSSITSAWYLTGHSARGTCAVRARGGGPAGDSEMFKLSLLLVLDGPT